MLCLRSCSTLSPDVCHLVMLIFSVLWSRSVEVNLSAEQVWISAYKLLEVEKK